jgi:hypothetical protein
MAYTSISLTEERKVWPDKLAEASGQLGHDAVV